MSQNYQAYIMLQKNWALAMVSLLLEEQMIISVTKPDSTGQIDFSEICPKNCHEIACFLFIVSQ